MSKSIPGIDQPDTALHNHVREPKKFKVLLHNDDYTTMEFVVEILMSVFSKTFPEAERIMRKVHEKGKGVCGIYPAEIAETKIELVHMRARSQGFPLKCTMQEV